MNQENVSQGPIESVSATTLIECPAPRVFGVLADPDQHAAIDGTGWVRQS
jgi:hypothetical protein